jgi:hypothetical protein
MKEGGREGRMRWKMKIRNRRNKRSRRREEGLGGGI